MARSTIFTLGLIFKGKTRRFLKNENDKSKQKALYVLRTLSCNNNFEKKNVNKVRNANNINMKKINGNVTDNMDMFCHLKNIQEIGHAKGGTFDLSPF